MPLKLNKSGAQRDKLEIASQGEEFHWKGVSKKPIKNHENVILVIVFDWNTYYILLYYY